jgi:hypothetical protein
MAANTAYSYTRLTSGTTVINKGKPVMLSAIWVNKALTGTVTLTDNGVTVATLTNGATAPLGSVVVSGNGPVSLTSLTVALSATEDITIFWS